MKIVTLSLTSHWRSAIMSLALAGAAATAFAGTVPKSPSAVVITKYENNRKHKVKLFTAADTRTILFSVDGVVGSQYSLYIFDLEGRLVVQTEIRNHEFSVLPEIASGEYVFEVFVADRKVENGQLTIRKD